MAEQAKQLRLQNELRQDTIDQLEIELSVQETMGDVRDASITRQQLIVELLEQQVALEKEKSATLSDNGEFDEAKQTKLTAINTRLTEMIGKYEDANEELSKHKKKLKKVEKAANKYDDIIGGFASKIGLGNSALKNSVGRLMTIGKELENNAEKQEEFAKAVQQTFSAANIAGSLLQSFVEFALVIDNAQASLAAATGAGDRFSLMMTQVKT